MWTAAITWPVPSANKYLLPMHTPIYYIYIIYIYIYTCALVSVSLCLQVCVCVCVCLCVCVYIYIYIYIHTHTRHRKCPINIDTYNRIWLILSSFSLLRYLKTIMNDNEYEYLWINLDSPVSKGYQLHQNSGGLY